MASGTSTASARPMVARVQNTQLASHFTVGGIGRDYTAAPAVTLLFRIGRRALRAVEIVEEIQTLRIDLESYRNRIAEIQQVVLLGIVDWPGGQPHAVRIACAREVRPVGFDRFGQLPVQVLI